MSVVPKNVQSSLEAFLTEKRESDGGYALLNDADMRLLATFLGHLREAKCERDPDGDIPLEFTMVNRKTHESLHYLPTRYRHEVYSQGTEAILNELRNRQLNLKIAMDAMDQINFDLQDKLRSTIENEKSGNRSTANAGARSKG